jgi:hypothetical protein
MTDQPKSIEPAPFDQQKEMLKQTQLLKSINDKLGFFVFILIIGIILQVFGALMSF